MMRWAVLIVLMIAGCAPTPPRETPTLQAAVVIAGDVIDMGAFAAEYPADWRVITSPADAEPFVIFAAPDDCSVIMLSVESIEIPTIGCPPDRALTHDTRAITIADGVIYALLLSDDVAAHMPTFDAVLESLTVAP